MTGTVPAVVTRYLGASAASDISVLADCFSPMGTVVDEGNTYRGQAEIRAWREALADKWIYTVTVTGSEAIETDEYRVNVHLEGNFPGGVADLSYRFRLQDGLITELIIA
jgi:ketosteroid isomerase-like protein